MIAFWKVNERYGEFSNWYMCPVQFNGITFINSEQAFMHYKAILFDDHETAEQILKAKTSAEFKHLGRQVKNFDQKEWDEVKAEAMFQINYAKFKNNNKLKNMLLATGDEEICEASPLDCVWGIGLAPDSLDVTDKSKWRGQNLLGKALMRVRETIRYIEGEQI